MTLQTPANPDGAPIEAFDQIRQGVSADRSQFYKDLSAPFYGANRPGQGKRQPAVPRPSASGAPRWVSVTPENSSTTVRILTMDLHLCDRAGNVTGADFAIDGGLITAL